MNLKYKILYIIPIQFARAILENVAVFLIHLVDAEKKEREEERGGKTRWDRRPKSLSRHLAVRQPAQW